MSRSSSVGIVIWLCAIRFTVRIPTGVRGLSFLQSVHLASGAPHSLLFSGYPGLFPSGSNGQGVKLTVHFHLVLRLRINGGAPLLALYAFVPNTGTTLLWPSSWNCKGTRTYATHVLIFVYLLWSQRYRCFRSCDVYRRLSLVCHVLPEASWLHDPASGSNPGSCPYSATGLPFSGMGSGFKCWRLVLGSFWCY